MTSANFKVVFWHGNVGTRTGNGNSHSFSLFLSGQDNRQEKVSSLTFSFILFIYDLSVGSTENKIFFAAVNEHSTTFFIHFE